ncbi:MAG: hypothetical protein KGV46_03305 [Pasteurella sp.]|nr:hypothetical protein [Pasteurella sp.]
MNMDSNKQDNIILSEVKETLDNVAKAILPKLIAINQTSIEGFVISHSDAVDKYILSVQQKEHLKYIAGHAVLKVISNSEMQMMFDLYFQDNQQNWVNKKTTASNFIMSDYLTDTALKELMLVKEMKFDIQSPEV